VLTALVDAGVTMRDESWFARWNTVAFAIALVAFAIGGCDGESGAGAVPDASPDGGADAGDVPICDMDVQQIYDDVAALSADELEGRKPGSQGNQDALEMVEVLFEQLGLEPAGESSTYRQAFSYEEWEITDSQLTVGGSGYEEWTDYAVFNYSGGGSVTAEVAFVGYGLTVPPFDEETYPSCPLDPAVGYDDFADVDVTDKIVLLMRHGPADDEDIYTSCPVNDACLDGPLDCAWIFGYKAANARAHGAAAMLMVQHYAELPAITGGTLGAEYFAEDFPALFLDRTQVEYALPDLPDWAEAIDDDLVPQSSLTGIEASVEVSSANLVYDTENLLGRMPGSDSGLSGETVLVSASIDSLGVHGPTGIIYNGADANASGIAVLMELARHFGEQPPARTLVFAAWNARDAGLLGSSHYTSNPTVPLGDITAVLNLDMLGAGDAIGVDLLGGTDPVNAWLVEVMQGAAAGEGIDLEVTAAPPPLPEEATADEFWFGASGVPAVTVSTLGGHYLHHTPDDVIETIDPDDLEAGACLTRAALTSLAQGTEDQYATKGAAPGGGAQRRLEPTEFWVFFSDKGVPADRLEQALDARATELAPRALERRRRVRGGRGVDERDLAVHREYVDEIAARGASVRSESRWLNGVSVNASSEQLEQIASLPFVDRLQPVARRLPRLEPPPRPAEAPMPDDPHPLNGGFDYGLPTEQLTMMGVPALHDCGYTGAGVVVAVQDGGFVLQHEVFENLDVIDEYDFINDDGFTGYSAGEDPFGQPDHGTSVLSLVAGWNEGTFCGVAPGVSVILSKTEDVSQEVPHEEDDFVEGLEWAEGLGAQIFTASLGYSLWYDQYEDMDGQTAVTSVAAATAVENGLIMINSAGNEGPSPMTVSAPADADGVIAVGALQLDGQIAGFSSRGPTSDWRMKPDVSAPGQDVWVANPHDMDGYQLSSGTSFAGPLTAGLVALLLEAYPDYGPAEIYDLLASSSTMSELPNNQYGWGLVSGEAAAPLMCTCHDEDADGYYDADCGGLDCDDGDSGINPDATDVPLDGVDQNCDGADNTQTGPPSFSALGGGISCGMVATAPGGGPGGLALWGLLFGLALALRRHRR